MKKVVLAASFLISVLFSLAASAQNYARNEEMLREQNDTIVVPEGYELVDTIIYVQSSRVDTALVGKSIFSILPSKMTGGKADVHVYQSQALVDALKETVQANVSRPVSGYRVRIFFDNRQSARRESENTVKIFQQLYPGIPAYRSYVNPYFKVAVGDFRSKSEAMRFLREITGSFPKAFIVREAISYPAVDKENAYYADTVKVLRPLTEAVVNL